MTAFPLASAFLGSSRWRDEPPDVALEHALTEHATLARAAWPEIVQADECWAAYVGARAPDDLAPMTALGQMRTSDLWAACACACGDVAAIASIRARWFGELAAALCHIHTSAALVDDVHAELLAQLFVAAPGQPPRITSYSGRGDLRSWLRSAAIRTALKQLGRAQAFVADDQILENLPGALEDPVLAQLKHEYRDDVRLAFQHAVAELTSRDRNLLRQYYLDRLTIDQLATTYGVHRATAARWLATVRDTLLAGTRTRLASQLGLASVEIDSILFVIHSQLDVSFARLVGG